MQITAKRRDESGAKEDNCEQEPNSAQKKEVKETGVSQGRLERKLQAQKGNTEKMDGGKGKREGAPIYLPFVFSVAE